MSLWLVVPVKSLRDGKSRLAPALSVAERRAFNQWLLVRTLRQAALFPGLERTLLVSACEEACACASAQGAQVLKERTLGGLNEALRQAQRWLSELGATRMLAVSGDLPLLRAQDLRQLAGAVSAHTIALAPDAQIVVPGSHGVIQRPSLRRVAVDALGQRLSAARRTRGCETRPPRRTSARRAGQSALSPS
jgi:2-phospho-L-lactate guanylyltransferase